MKNNVRKYLDKLKLIDSIKDKKMRNRMIAAMMDEGMLKAIKEIILNCTRHYHSLAPAQKRNLARIRKPMKSVLKSNYTKSNKNRINAQVGGFWQFLIPVGIELISQLIR